MPLDQRLRSSYVELLKVDLSDISLGIKYRLSSVIVIWELNASHPLLPARDHSFRQQVAWECWKVLCLACMELQKIRRLLLFCDLMKWHSDNCFRRATHFCDWAPPFASFYTQRRCLLHSDGEGNTFEQPGALIILVAECDVGARWPYGCCWRWRRDWVR